MSVAEKILERVRTLPPAKLDRVLAYVEQIAAEVPAPTAKPRLFNPRGTAQGLAGDLPLSVFQENRREMWGTATERELE
jgi:hypothetical protein